MRKTFYLVVLLVVFLTHVGIGKTFPVAATQPTQAEIEAAVNTAQTEGRVIDVANGNSLSIPALLKASTTLPVTFRSKIDNWNYDITVLEMNFTPSGATLTIGCRFSIPNATTPTYLYFGKSNVAMSGATGFSDDLPILESSLGNTGLDASFSTLLGGESNFAEVSLPTFRGNLFMGLNKNSKVHLECGTFQKFIFSGYVKSVNTVETEDNAGATTNKPLVLAFNTQDVFDWQDMFFTATASQGFHASYYKDLGFLPTGTSTVIDLSIFRNPPSLPTCANISGNYWQGIYFGAFDVRLPNIFKLHTPRKLTTKSTNLLLDPNGLVGTMTAQPIFPLEDGYTDEVNQFDMSLDLFSANYGCQSNLNVLMNGKVRFPSCSNGIRQASTGEGDVSYIISYSPQENYKISSSVISKNTPAYSLQGVGLSTGATLSFDISQSGFAMQGKGTEKPTIGSNVYKNKVCLLDNTVQLTANNCSNTITWSDGQVGAVVTVKPTTTTTYTAKCVDKYCVGNFSDPLTITVYDKLLTPTLTASNTAFCADKTVTITADNCEGIMQWTVPENTTFHEIATDTRQLTIKKEAGSYTYKVRCSLNNNCLSDEATQTLTIYPLPEVPIVSATPADKKICLGQPISLEATCSTGMPSWGNTLSGSTTVKPLIVGNNTYTSTCTTSQGCKTDAPITVQAIQAPISAIQRDPAREVIVTGDGKNYYDLWIDGCDGDVHWVDESGYDFLSTNGAANRTGNGIQLHNVGKYRYKAYCIDKQNCKSVETDWVSVEIKQTPIGVVAQAYPKDIHHGEGTQLYLDNAYQCTNGIVWLNPFDGQIWQPAPYISSIMQSRTYVARCYYGKDGGRDLYVESSVNINCTPFPPPQIQAVASPNPVSEGGSTTLSLRGGEQCTKAIYWFGGDMPKIIDSPSTKRDNIVNATTYNVSCYYGKTGEVVNSSVTVEVKTTPEPVIRAVATPSSVSYNGSTDLSINIISGSCKNILWSDGRGNFFTDLHKSGLQSSVAYLCSCFYTNHGKEKQVDSWVSIEVGKPSPCEGKSTEPKWVNKEQDVCRNNISYLTEQDQNECSNSHNDLRYTTVGRSACDGCTPKWVTQNVDVCVNNVSYLTEKDITPCSATYNKTRTTTLGGSADCNCIGKSTDPTWVQVGDVFCKDKESYITQKDTNPCSTTPANERTHIVKGGGLVCNSTEHIEYTGVTSLCGTGKQYVEGKFSGCTNGNIQVKKEDNSVSSMWLETGVNYIATCIKDGIIVSETSFSIDLQEIPSTSISPASASITKGNSIILTATGAMSYRWNNNETSNQITVSPNANATYSVTGYSGLQQSGCNSSVTKTVIVTEPVCTENANIPTIAINGSICSNNPNSSVTLTASNCNGVLSWSSKNVGVGTYSVACTKGCDKKWSNEISISSQDMPTASITDNSQLPERALRANCSSDSNIEWYKDGSYYTPSTFMLDVKNVTRTTHYELRCKNTCGSASAEVYVNP